MSEDVTHESWGLARFNRYQGGNHAMFDSSIRHHGGISFQISRASRSRNLHRDWLREEDPLVECRISEAQFGALVSSFGQGTGVPVTLTYVGGERMQEPPFDSRLDETAREVRDRAREPMREPLERIESMLNGDRKINKTELRSLQALLANTASNLKFSADSLTEHAESVVTKARADIEAMVSVQARFLGIEAAAVEQSRMLGDGS